MLNLEFFQSVQGDDLILMPLRIRGFQVVGVRTLGMTGNKAAIDLDLRWAGNAEFVLEAGVKPVPLLITLDKIRFSGRMRVELAPLVPVVSCLLCLISPVMGRAGVHVKVRVPPACLISREDDDSSSNGSRRQFWFALGEEGFECCGDGHGGA